jgi:hypothetical protein
MRSSFPQLRTAKRKRRTVSGSLFVAAANPERSREAEPPETGLSISDDCWLIADKLRPQRLAILIIFPIFVGLKRKTKIKSDKTLWKTNFKS